MRTSTPRTLEAMTSLDDLGYLLLYTARIRDGVFWTVPKTAGTATSLRLEKAGYITWAGMVPMTCEGGKELQHEWMVTAAGREELAAYESRKKAIALVRLVKR